MIRPQRTALIPRKFFEKGAMEISHLYGSIVRFYTFPFGFGVFRYFMLKRLGCQKTHAVWLPPVPTDGFNAERSFRCMCAMTIKWILIFSLHCPGPCPGCVQPSTNVEQKIKEITEGISEGKAKKVQLNWTPQPRPACDQTVFSAYKGVKTYDLCKKHDLLVTGGMDRLVRLWNPCVPG